MEEIIDLMFIILQEYYNIDFTKIPLIETQIILYLSKNYYWWIHRKLAYCFIQELDKIHFNKINEDIEIYKFHYNDRIPISQLVNKINYLIKKN